MTRVASHRLQPAAAHLAQPACAWCCAAMARVMARNPHASPPGPGDDDWVDIPLAGVFEVNAQGLILRWTDYFDDKKFRAAQADLQKRMKAKL